MTRYPSRHRYSHRASRSLHHRQLRQAALLADLQDMLDMRPRHAPIIRTVTHHTARLPAGL